MHSSSAWPFLSLGALISGFQDFRKEEKVRRAAESHASSHMA